MVRDLGADGVFLDTLKKAEPELVAKLEAARPGIVLEGESKLPVERIADHSTSWAQFFADSPVPGVLRAHWFERRHMQHHIRRWHRDHSEELQSAWLNGVGMMVREVVFGVWVGWNARDAATMKRMLTVQRAVPDLLLDGDGRHSPRWPTRPRRQASTPPPGATVPCGSTRSSTAATPTTSARSVPAGVHRAASPTAPAPRAGRLFVPARGSPASRSAWSRATRRRGRARARALDRRRDRRPGRGGETRDPGRRCADGALGRVPASPRGGAAARAARDGRGAGVRVRGRAPRTSTCSPQRYRAARPACTAERALRGRVEAAASRGCTMRGRCRARSTVATRGRRGGRAGGEQRRDRRRSRRLRLASRRRRPLPWPTGSTGPRPLSRPTCR